MSITAAPLRVVLVVMQSSGVRYAASFRVDTGLIPIVNNKADSPRIQDLNSSVEENFHIQEKVLSLTPVDILYLGASAH